MNDDITAFGTISIGGAIRQLQRCLIDKRVYFDFCNLVPTTVASYRGHYDHLAIGWTEDAEIGKEVFPTPLIARLSEAIGKTFEGYKGGTYLMRDDSPLWVANYGECTGTQIVSIEEIDWCVLINTKDEDAR